MCAPPPPPLEAIATLWDNSLACVGVGGGGVRRGVQVGRYLLDRLGPLGTQLRQASYPLSDELFLLYYLAVLLP